MAANTAGTAWVAARCLDSDGVPRWHLGGEYPLTTRRVLPQIVSRLPGTAGRDTVRVGRRDWHLAWWSGPDVFLTVAWPEASAPPVVPDVQPLLVALEAASLRGRVSGLEAARRQLLERASHEVRNSLFTLRRTVELEAQSKPDDRALTAVLGRLRALFLIYTHLADSSFEAADARPLIGKMLPDSAARDLGAEPLVVADRQTRWLAQALHELTTASTAPVESVTIEIDDGVLDVAILWQTDGRLDPDVEPVRWAIAEQLVREGLRGRLDDTGDALHVRCIAEDLRIGAQIHPAADRTGRAHHEVAT